MSEALYPPHQLSPHSHRCVAYSDLGGGSNASCACVEITRETDQCDLHFTARVRSSIKGREYESILTLAIVKGDSLTPAQ